MKFGGYEAVLTTLANDSIEHSFIVIIDSALVYKVPTVDLHKMPLWELYI